MRKVSGGLKALATWLEQSSNGQYLIGDSFSLADVAAGCVLGYMSVRWPDHGWKKEYPELERYWKGLEERESFRDTSPSPQNIKDAVV